MVITTDKEVLAKPINALIKKATAVSSPCTSDNNSEDGDKVKKPKEVEARGEWSSEIDFAMSCIAYAVGLGNVWRFPYLCFKNGGGAFLVPYFFSMIICGVPLFFLEVAVGQYLGVGGMSVVGQLCPIFKGVGYSAIMMVFLENVYYIIVVTWTLFYLFNTFMYLPDLPWSSCENGNGTWANMTNCFSPLGNNTYANSAAFAAGLTENETESPVEQFWKKEVLNMSSGIDDIGSIQWDLFGFLLLAWAVVYVVIWKGLHNSPKVLWFSAMFPYLVLSILFVKVLTLDGAVDGLKFLFTPSWERLGSAECWIDGGTQIFFSYGVGIGALLALGSYNKFHHNCHRDTLIVCSINTFTSFFSATVIFSVLGNMAYNKGVGVKDVVESGPGLAFLVYPEAVLQITPSPLWAFLFFVMLLTLGVDSQFCGVESLMTGLLDNWSDTLRPHRKKFTLAMVVFMFLLGLPMITNGGVYIFQLMDFYAASGMSLLHCVFFQTIAISWCFGAKKLYICIEDMVGYKVGWYWYICWMVLSPAFMVFIFAFYFIRYTPITYGEHYAYPWWGEILGFMISASSMIWVIGYALYYFLTTPGTWREVLKKGITPVITLRPEAIIAEQKARMKAARENQDVEMKMVVDPSEGSNMIMDQDMSEGAKMIKDQDITDHVVS